MSAVPNNRKEGGFIIPLLLVIVVIVVVAIIISANKEKASYQASSTGIAVISSSEVSVSFRVKNVGQSSGTPDCTIRVNSSDHRNYGVTAGKLSNPVAAGATNNSADTVTVVHNGAASITAAQVTCV